MDESALMEMESDLEILKKQMKRYVYADVLHLENEIELHQRKVLEEQIDELEQRIYDVRRIIADPKCNTDFQSRMRRPDKRYTVLGFGEYSTG